MRITRQEELREGGTGTFSGLEGERHLFASPGGFLGCMQGCSCVVCRALTKTGLSKDLIHRTAV